MANRLIQRHDTAANWSRYNPILAEGELGFVTDQSNRYKIGDGITAWNNLPLQGFNGNVVNELGNDEGSVLSQKFATEKLTELESEVNGTIITLNLKTNSNFAINKDSLLFKEGGVYQSLPYTNGYGVTDYIDVHGQKILNILSNCYQYPDHSDTPRFVAICFYNENKNYIANYMAENLYDGEDVLGTINIPSTAYYFRAVCKNQNFPLVWNNGEDKISDLSHEIAEQTQDIADINEYLKREVLEASYSEKDSILFKEGGVYQAKPYTDGCGVTDYIDIHDNAKLNIMSNCYQYPDATPTRFAAICFYDENKTFVSNFIGVNKEEFVGVINIPSTAYYFRAILKDQTLPLLYSTSVDDAMTSLSMLKNSIGLPNCVVKYTKETDVFEVYQRYDSNIYFLLTLNHIQTDYSVNNTNLWRIASSGGVFQYLNGGFSALNIKLLNSPENEFAMKFENTNDFIGGYHGNERYDVNDGFVKFYIDGIEITDLSSDFLVECNYFYMLQKSTLYMNSASSQMVAGNPIVGTHYKKTEFVDSGYKCTNRVDFNLTSVGKEQLNVDTWFTGLCCIAKDSSTQAYADNFEIIDTSKANNESHHVLNSVTGDVVMIGRKGVSCYIESEVLSEQDKGCQIRIWDREYGDTKYYRYAPTRSVKTGDTFMNKQKVSWRFIL